jgi:flagellar hook-associated protein 3 FlgL
MLARSEQYRRNITDAKGWTNNYETVMTELQQLLMESKEIAIKGADNAQSADTRNILAQRINGILDQVLSAANSEYVGKSIFAGTLTNETEPFAYDGSTVTYQGNDVTMSRRIAEGLDLEISISGTELNATGIFSALIDLRTALEANDRAGVATIINNVDSAAEGVLTLSSKVGLMQSHLDMTEVRLDTADTNILSFLSKAEDADLAEVISKYNNEEIAYKAALQTAAEAMHLNILDFLR